MRDWAYRQNEKCWQSLKTCRQTKEMITGRCRRREWDLLALSRQTLRLVIGILTGHAPVQRHLSLMSLINDPFCSYCNKEIESASHLLCCCNYFAMIRTAIWGKPSLHPNDIDCATVRDITRHLWANLNRFRILWTTALYQDSVAFLLLYISQVMRQSSDWACSANDKKKKRDINNK